MLKRRFTSFILVVVCLIMFWYTFYSGSKPFRNVDPTTGILNVESYTKQCFPRARLLSILETKISQINLKASTDCFNEKDALISEIRRIYVITPTFTRPSQKAELTRLSQAFMLVPNLYWIVVEDSEKKTGLVKSLLAKTGLPYSHLSIPTPTNWKLKSRDPHWSKPRGVIQRNAALEWLRNNISPQDEGVLYFADDDNTYSIELFEEMRDVKTVGVWPVGLVGGVKVERPKVNEGKVSGWLTVWGPDRPFAIDMAGFAVNLQRFAARPKGKFAYEVEKGYQESEFLRHFVDSLEELEPRADNCTKVYVWHTRTEIPNLTQENMLAKERKPPTDVDIEV